MPLNKERVTEQKSMYKVSKLQILTQKVYALENADTAINSIFYQVLRNRAFLTALLIGLPSQQIPLSVFLY